MVVNPVRRANTEAMTLHILTVWNVIFAEKVRFL